MRLSEAYAKCIEERNRIELFQNELESQYDVIKINCDEEDMVRFNYSFRYFCEYVKQKFSTIEYLCEAIEDADSNVNIDDEDIIDCNMRIFNEFYRRVQCIILLNGRIGNRDEESIGLDIKLPRMNTIIDLKKYIDSLEFVFTKCPFFQSDDASLKLETVESGSIWLIFGVTCASVAVGSVFLNNIAAFIDKCFVIKSHKLTCERQEQEIKNAQMENKEKEELLKSVDRLFRLSVEYVIKELQESTGYHIQDGEEMGRVEQSFEKMVKMLEQGLQIHASLNSPQEIKALFAPLEMHYVSMGKEVEKIEQKAETDTE